MKSFRINFCLLRIPEPSFYTYMIPNRMRNIHALKKSRLTDQTIPDAAHQM